MQSHVPDVFASRSFAIFGTVTSVRRSGDQICFVVSDASKTRKSSCLAWRAMAASLRPDHGSTCQATFVWLTHLLGPCPARSSYCRGPGRFQMLELATFRHAFCDSFLEDMF